MFLWTWGWWDYAGTGSTELVLSPAPSFSVLVSIFIVPLHPYISVHLPTLTAHTNIDTFTTFALVFLWPRSPSQVIIHMNLNFVFFLTVSYVMILHYIYLINWSQIYQNKIPNHICLHIKLFGTIFENFWTLLSAYM